MGHPELWRCAGSGFGEDVVDEAEVVVGQEESVRCCGEDAAGAAVDEGFAGVVECEEAGDEVLGLVFAVGEADNAVAGADCGTAGSVEGDEECVFEDGVGRSEVREAQR